MELKRGRIQSFASKHCNKGKELMEKYSHRERNRVLDYVHKFVNKLLERYPPTTFAVEKLNKQEMFRDADDKLPKLREHRLYRVCGRHLQVGVKVWTKEYTQRSTYPPPKGGAFSPPQTISLLRKTRRAQLSRK
jgi:IS605 OrfB family transposase